VGQVAQPANGWVPVRLLGRMVSCRIDCAPSVSVDFEQSAQVLSVAIRNDSPPSSSSSLHGAQSSSNYAEEKGASIEEDMTHLGCKSDCLLYDIHAHLCNPPLLRAVNQCVSPAPESTK
jgi:hypothetical protein